MRRRLLFKVYCFVNQIPVYNSTARRIRPLSFGVDRKKRSNLHTLGTVIWVGPWNNGRSRK